MQHLHVSATRAAVLLPLRLGCLHSQYLLSPRLLQQLSQHGLQSLYTSDTDPDHFTPAVCSAFAQLTGLTSLWIDTACIGSCNAPTCPITIELARALGVLPSLANLECNITPEVAQYLPVSLTNMRIEVEDCQTGPGGAEEGVAAVNTVSRCSLSHLTNLCDLELYCCPSGVVVVPLPERVKKVEVWGEGGLQVQGLQCVESAYLWTD